MDLRKPHELPLPSLGMREAGGIAHLTDPALEDACGVRIAFTGRAGGVSEGGYAGLNLGDHVGDDPKAVAENRRRLVRALGAEGCELVVAKQVHGTRIAVVDDRRDAACASAFAKDGADGVCVKMADVAALLCFADCVPVIMVDANGAFAVVHAGWRGVVLGIAVEALGVLTDAPERCNVYLGPHIRSCCFECGEDVAARFVSLFGPDVLCGSGRVDLRLALTRSLVAAGVREERICDAGICTMCRSDDYFSYRAQDGACGRHGAFAVRRM